MNTKSPRTARRSRREQNEQKVKAVREKAPEKFDPLKKGSRLPSPIADWMLTRSEVAWQRLLRAAASGALTKADLQGALMVQFRQELDAFDATPHAGFEDCRKAFVNRQRLLRASLDVVRDSVTSGPLQVVRLVWPAHYFAHDPGEDVRLEEPGEGRALS